MYLSADLIIPAYAPGKELRELLRRIKRQTHPINKIIIMNTEESLWDPDISRDYPDLEIHHLPKSEFDHGGTRRLAATYSTADVMIFMTQDALPKDSYLVENLIKALYQSPDHASAPIAAAYARQLPKKDCSYLESYTRSFNYPDRSFTKTSEDLPRLGIKTYFCSNVCAAYRRDIYEMSSGFIPRTIFNEDMIYAAEIITSGYAISYAADARVIHSHNYTPLQQLHRNFDLGVSQAEHPEIFREIPSEGEGMKLVINTIRHLMTTGRFYLIPELIIQSGFKYAGYLAGKHYASLPKSLILKLTMNREYW